MPQSTTPVPARRSPPPRDSRSPRARPLSSRVPLRILQFQDTPNPNALKCVLDHRLPDTPRSYFSAGQVDSDPLAARLFAIPGITNLLIHETFITLGKAPNADWKSIKPGVELALRDFTP